MDLIEVDNPSLGCMVPKTYARPSLAVPRIGELVDLISSTRGRTSWAVSTSTSSAGAPPQGARSRGEFYTHQSVDKLLLEMLEPMNRRVYGCRGSGGMVVQAERFVDIHGGQHRATSHIGLEPSHLSQQLRVLRRAGLGPQQQNRTTVTYTLSHPPVVDPLTITRSRLHNVINDRMESLTELQPISPTSECPEQS